MDSVPSKATFSRAFSLFCKHGLGDKVHEALIDQFVSGKGDDRPIVLHVSHGGEIAPSDFLDSTAVESRERGGGKRIKQAQEKKTRQTL